jgi:hypothetical protein
MQHEHSWPGRVLSWIAERLLRLADQFLLPGIPEAEELKCYEETGLGDDDIETLPDPTPEPPVGPQPYESISLRPVPDFSYNGQPIPWDAIRKARAERLAQSKNVALRFKEKLDNGEKLGPSQMHLMMAHGIIPFLTPRKPCAWTTESIFNVDLEIE